MKKKDTFPNLGALRAFGKAASSWEQNRLGIQSSTALVQILYLLLLLLTLHPKIGSAEALVAGLALGLTLGNPWLAATKKATPKLLAFSVVGLGAGMDLNVIAQVGISGVGYTVVGISLTLLLGWWLGKTLKVSPDSTTLISVGTAICGGSAIAAVSPVIRAKSHDVSLSLVIVFLLNALALFLFPWMGHFFHLSEHQFGLFSALAIHDTSSVVASASQFGPKALEVATTVKLTRALWIIPVTLLLAAHKNRSLEGHPSQPGSPPLKRPYFIFGFLLMAAIMTWFPTLRPTGALLCAFAKKMLVVTLFLIGSNVPRSALKEVGIKPMLLGVMLWFLVSSMTLGAIQLGWIS